MGLIFKTYKAWDTAKWICIPMPGQSIKKMAPPRPVIASPIE
jgi:hypothetical protein